MALNWIFLIVGGLFETCFALSLERAGQSSGKALVLWLLSFVVSVSISMFLLFKAISGPHAIPVGTGYAVWGGIGAVFTVLAGIFFLGESTSFWRLFFLTTLILSIIWLEPVFEVKTTFSQKKREGQCRILALPLSLLYRDLVPLSLAGASICGASHQRISEGLHRNARLKRTA